MTQVLVDEEVLIKTARLVEKGLTLWNPTECKVYFRAVSDNLARLLVERKPDPGGVTQQLNSNRAFAFLNRRIEASFQVMGTLMDKMIEFEDRLKGLEEHNNTKGRFCKDCKYSDFKQTYPHGKCCRLAVIPLPVVEATGPCSSWGANNG